MTKTWLALALLVAACSGTMTTGGPGTGDDDSVMGDDDDDTPPTDDFQELIGGDWSLPPSAQGYACVILTVPRTMYVTGFEPVTPLGTHHTVLSRIELPPAQIPADGLYLGEGLGSSTWCTGFTSGTNMIFGSGVGTPRLEFPAGVAVKLNAGEKLVLNLHLFNTGDGTITGRSGTRIREADASTVQHEAEVVLMGKTAGLSIPAHALGYEQSGTCTISGQEVNVFAVAPHMHMLGTHLKTEIVHTGATKAMLYDKDYWFDEQVPDPVAPIQTAAVGDVIRTTCVYDNPTDSPVGFGEHTEDEMCFSTVYYYPAIGRRPTCSD